MGILSNLLDAIKDNNKDPIILPDALTFTAIDASAIEAQLNLKFRAEEFGAKGYPPKDQIPPDSVESELSREVNLRLRPIQDLYEENQKAYSARLAALEPLTLANQVKGRVAGQKAEIAVALADTKNHMFDTLRRLEETQKIYRDLKTQYGGLADPIDQIKPWWKKILLVFVFILIEGIVNGFSVEAYMTGGWAEALMVTIGIPFLTVGVIAFLIGIGLQYSRRESNKQHRPIMWVGFFLGIILALLANLYISSFRIAGTKALDSITEVGFSNPEVAPIMPNISELATQTWLGLFAGNFESIDVISVVLFFLATTFFGFAVYKFYYFSHRHPDFVDAYIKWEKAVQDHRIRTSQLRLKFEEFKKINSEFDRVYLLLQAWAVEHAQLIDSQNTLYNKFLSYQTHCKETFLMLVRKYRSWNLSARKDPSTAPLYFKEEVRNSDIKEPSPVSRPSNSKDFAARIAKANKAIRESHEEISQEISRFSALAQSITEVSERNA